MPAAPAKLLHILGLLWKEEATYGTAIALTAGTDGAQLYYKDRNVGAPLQYAYLYDGNIGPSIGALGNLKRIGPSGLSLKGPLPFLMRTSGAAYSAAVVPSLHRPLKASGFDATVDITGGAEKWTYSPTAGGSTFTSLTANLYTRGEKLIAIGVVGSIKLDAPDLAPPVWSFDFNGIGTLPTDSACPVITYPNAAVAPTPAANFQLTMGSLVTNAVVRKSSFDLARKVKERLNQSAAGSHAGFAPDDRDPIMTVTLERTALVGTPFTSASAFDAWNLRDSGQNIAAILQYGSAQYLRTKINFPQAQVIDVKDSNDGPVATVDLTIAAYNSTPTSNDDVTIVCD